MIEAETAAAWKTRMQSMRGCETWEFSIVSSSSTLVVQQIILDSVEIRVRMFFTPSCSLVKMPRTRLLRHSTPIFRGQTLITTASLEDVQQELSALVGG